MKISKTLITAMIVAVTVGTAISCTKSVDGKPKQPTGKNLANDTIPVIPDGCPACGMG